MEKTAKGQGRAYEYAWIQVLYAALRKRRKTRIVQNSSLAANERAWNMQDASTQELLLVSSKAAVKTIIELEPRIIENDGDELFLEFQKDEAGERGDVRDILIKRSAIQWEVGLSIKHNHEAVKHSRLGSQLDFGNVWFGMPCSEKYWKNITPIFERLKAEKARGAKWSDLPDKEEGVYIPLLKAFMEEVKRAYGKSPSIAKKMVEYLIGTEDYYKAISHDSKHLTLVRTFNIHGTLNKPSKVKVSAVTVPIVKLPTELVALKFKAGSTNTVEMYLNNGWQLNFRIHNASTKVELSLKFDIQFVGMPTSVLKLECKWHKS